MTNDDRSLRPYAFPGVDARTDTFSALQPTDAAEQALPQNGDAHADRAVETARTLSAMVQDLVHQLDEQATQRRELEERLQALEQATRGYAALRDQLRDVFSGAVTREDLQTIQRVLQDLSQDPNHIMVLASVAQQAGKLLAVVQGYTRIQEALSR
jgi:exonuclease VII large subunit